MSSAGGETLSVIGKTDLSLEVQGFPVQVKSALVCTNLDADMLFGKQFLKREKIVTDMDFLATKEFRNPVDC